MKKPYLFLCLAVLLMSARVFSSFGKSVLGGAFAFGFVGVFLGPVLLAVGYALIKEWAVGKPATAAAAPSTGAPGGTT